MAAVPARRQRPFSPHLAILALAGVAFSSLTAVSVGCGGGGGGSGSSSTTSSSTGMFCPGGFVRTTNGVKSCEGLCKASACTNPNNTCVDNRCALICSSHFDCQLGQDCSPSTEDGSGKMIMTCQSNGKVAIGTKCPNGTECGGISSCGDGTACSGSCTSGACQALTCLGSGMGDSDAYCTAFDCHSDADCPGGYWCDTVRDPHQICGGPVPGAACGKTTDPCVDPSKDAANGTTFQQADICTQRNQCRLRGQCDPCKTDLDCSMFAGMKCVTGSCLFDCASDASCAPGFQCTMGSCVPRSGSCAPAQSGAAKFCEACRTQADCGNGLICGRLDVGGLRACYNVNATACMTDADCPSSPSGLHAVCGDARLQLAAGQPGYHQCLDAPYFDTLKLACWAANPGQGCIAGTDCISGTCKGGDATTQTPGICQ